MKTVYRYGAALAMATALTCGTLAADEKQEAWQTDYAAFVTTVGASLAANAFIIEIPAGIMMGNQQPRWGLCSSDQQKAYDALDNLLTGKLVFWRGIVQRVITDAKGVSVVVGLEKEKQVSGKWDFPNIAMLTIDGKDRPFPVADWNDPPGVWVMLPTSANASITSMKEGQEVTFRGKIGKSKLPDSGIILIAGYGGSFSGRHCVSLFLDAGDVISVKAGQQQADTGMPKTAMPPSATGNQPDGAWPQYAEELRGQNPVRVKNPNEFDVKVGLRSGTSGKDFTVSAGATTTVEVPDGAYAIYFRYSTDPDGLYKGDDFRLNRNGVEIQIVKVVNGNYGIRKVK